MLWIWRCHYNIHDMLWGNVPSNVEATLVLCCVFDIAISTLQQNGNNTFIVQRELNILSHVEATLDQLCNFVVVASPLPQRIVYMTLWLYHNVSFLESCSKTKLTWKLTHFENSMTLNARCRLFNPFVLNAPFLHRENRKIFWRFQGVEKGCIGSEWVNKMKSFL